MASGNSLITITPLSAILPSSGFPQFDVRNGTHLVLNHDAAAVETFYAETVLPRHYSGGGITGILSWMAASATSGDTVWSVTFERHDDEGLDLDADSFGTEVTVTATAPGTTGMVQYSTLSFTAGALMDSLAVGEHFRLRIRRNATAVGDTMTADAQFCALELYET